jgi:RHH-type transcriptional regulator, rel operon repressor / antitoxin RelB
MSLPKLAGHQGAELRALHALILSEINSIRPPSLPLLICDHPLFVAYSLTCTHTYYIKCVVLQRYNTMAPKKLMTTKSFNVRLPDALFGQLEALASATDRSKSFLAIEALRSYISDEAWQIQDIVEGLAEADRGEFATEAEVQAVFKKYGA